MLFPVGDRWRERFPLSPPGGARYRGSLAGFRVEPNRMIAALAPQFATVLMQVTLQIA